MNKISTALRRMADRIDGERGMDSRVVLRVGRKGSDHVDARVILECDDLKDGVVALAKVSRPGYMVTLARELGLAMDAPDGVYVSTYEEGDEDDYEDED